METLALVSSRGPEVDGRNHEQKVREFGDGDWLRGKGRGM